MRTFTQEEEDYIVELYLSTGKLSVPREKLKADVKAIKSVLVSRGIKVSLRKQPLNIEYFKEIDSPEKAYWLGFIAADGCIQKCGYKLTFGVKDADILFKFQKSIGAGSPVRYREVFDKRTGKTNQQHNIQICSKEFCQYIKNHGVDENKSKNFVFPKINPKLLSHFIRGIYDGDGSIHIKESPKNNKCHFRVNIISTLAGVESINEIILKELNIEGNKILASAYENVFYFNLSKDSEVFLDWLYKDSTSETRLDRKYKKYIENRHRVFKWDRIVKNIKTGKEFRGDSLLGICKRLGLNNVLLAKNFKENREPKSGKHADWRLMN